MRYNTRVSHLNIIYASTSGHTEYVIKKVQEYWNDSAATRVELAQPDDLQRGDALLLASSTWNTGGIEGQLNPHMDAFVYGRAKDINFNGKRVIVIGLGDHRSRYTCAAADKLAEFVKSHGGTLIEPVLRIINEPFGQEDAVTNWMKKVGPHIS